MENSSQKQPEPAFDNSLSLVRRLKSLRGALNAAVGRVQPFVLLVSCAGILCAYLVGMYVTGTLHSASRWMGAMLSCTSVVVVLQKGAYRDSLSVGWMRVFGTFLGALIAYIYLRLLPFTVTGMLGAVFLLEMLLMVLNIYATGYIATITLLIIMLVSQMTPGVDPATNCMLRFFESAAGVATGVAILWVIDRWRAWRKRLLRMGANTDGNPVDMDTMPLRWGHLRVVFVSSLGQFTGAGLATIVGIMIPLMQLVLHPELRPLMQGVLASASLLGIMAGSAAVGYLADRHGYLRYFRICPLIVLAASLYGFAAEGPWRLAAALFAMGVGIGGEYGLDGDYISETMPVRWRQTMVGIAKAASAFGNIFAAVACYFILRTWHDALEWRSLLLLVSLLAAVMSLTRIRFAQSPGWLLARGREEEAERAVRYLLGQDVTLGGELRNRPRKGGGQVGWRELFRGENLRRVVFSGVPWACEGAGVYGIGIFLPVLIIAMGLGADAGDAFGRVVHSVRTTAYVNLFVAAGFIAGLLLLERIDRIRMQTMGFLLCAAGLGVLLAAHLLHLPAWAAIAGFMIFELFINAGPHLVTFILPSEIYSVAERGAGAGIAAAFGKAGAVIGVFFFPLLMRWGGVALALSVTIVLQIAGAAVTAIAGRRITPPKNGGGPAPEKV